MAYTNIINDLAVYLLGPSPEDWLTLLLWALSLAVLAPLADALEGLWTA